MAKFTTNEALIYNKWSIFCRAKCTQFFAFSWHFETIHWAENKTKKFCEANMIVVFKLHIEFKQFWWQEIYVSQERTLSQPWLVLWLTRMSLETSKWRWLINLGWAGSRNVTGLNLLRGPNSFQDSKWTAGWKWNKLKYLTMDLESDLSTGKSISFIYKYTNKIN